MPGFDANGNFTRAHNWQQDRTNGIRILADRHDAEDDNFAGAFNQTFLRNGAVPMTGNLNMNGKKITTIAAGTVLLPGLTFELSPSTGLYQETPNSMSFSCNGVKQMEVRVDAIAMPFWTVGRQAALNNGQIVGTGDYPSIVYNPNAWAGTGMQIGAGVNKGIAAAGDYAYINIPTGKFFEICHANVQLLETRAEGILTSGFSLSNSNGVWRSQDAGAGVYPGAAGVGIEIWKNGIQSYNRTAGAIAPMRIDASLYTFNDNATPGSRGIIQMVAGNDPAVTPALLDIRVNGIGGTTAAPQYGIRFDGTNGSSNVASIMYGIWSYAKQNVGGAAVGVYGETPANSGATAHGVHGKASYFPNVSYGFGMCAGVYGEVVNSTSPAPGSYCAAGAFENKGTVGFINVGMYSSTVAGSANPQPIRCEHAGALVFVVSDVAVACKTATTASASNLFQASDMVSLLRSTSALRYKREVQPLKATDAHKLRAVKPIQFKSRSEADDPDTIFYGFIAEDVEQAGLTPLVHYAFQEDQIELVPDATSTEESPHFNRVIREGEQKRPDGVQYERVVVLQQLLINELYERLEALEGKL